MNIDQFSRSNKIAYYKRFDNYERLIEDPKSYIIDYLNYGDKRLKMKSPDDIKYYHTISIYLLGILLFSNMTKLNKNISEYINMNKDDEFIYSWFIGSFIHDLGYSVATKNIFNNIFDSRSTKEVVEKLLVKVDKIKSKMINAVPSDIRKNIDKYHEFRIWLNNHQVGAFEYVDHGLLAGIFFINNREQEFEKKKRNGELELIYDDIYIDKHTNLKWSNSILNGVQLNMASIICAHNIFYQQPNSEFAEQYIKLGMNELITDKPKFSLEDYPLYFLFQLVDTIDVYKKYSEFRLDLDEKCKLIKVFNDINYEFLEDSIVMNFIDFESSFVFNYFKKLEQQEYWLPIKISYESNKITIKI